MQSKYSVRLIVAADGERICLVTERVTGLPVFEANLYALSVLRPASGSHSSVDQSLREVVAALEFFHTRAIDWPARVASGTFLTPQEIDGLVQSLYVRDPRSKASWNGRGRGRNCGRLSPGTVALRLDTIVHSLNWGIQLHGHRVWARPDERIVGEQQAELFLKRLAARKPKVRSHGTRRGLTAEQLVTLFAALHKLADEADQAGDAQSRFIADRTLLWFDWQLEAGHRTGEMLGIRFRDIDYEAGTYKIVRRPDAQDDPRPDLARVKGEGRKLPLSPYLAERTREHEKMRARCPHAEAHDFLFVASDGTPLSRSSMNKLFQQLRTNNPALGKDFCSHVMRWTWNEQFSEDAATAGLSETEELQARALVMGWRNVASANHYLVHRTRKLVAEISRRSQERQMAARGGAHA